jgi:hypothetical protein
MISELFIKVIINVLLISLYLGVFFFTYGSMLQKQVVKSQMAFLVNNICNIIKLFGPFVSLQLNTFFKNMVLPDLSEEDKYVTELNKKTLKNAVYANVFLIICVIMCVIGIYYFAKQNNVSINLKKILTQNFIILLFIAITEFTFFNYFASKYIPINPNQTKLTVIKNLENILY